jgi:hypothetical protein
MQSETSRLVLNELERCENLSATEIQEFVSRLRQAIRREYQAQAVRLKRQNLSTNLSTELSTNLSTMHKEERSEKENLPPTPPIREKGKKEEMPPAAATRASRVRGECPSWEQVKERAEVSLKCRDFDRLLPIIEQIVKKRPQPQRVDNATRHQKAHFKALSREKIFQRGGKPLLTFISPNKSRHETSI